VRGRVARPDLGHEVRRVITLVRPQGAAPGPGFQGHHQLDLPAEPGVDHPCEDRVHPRVPAIQHRRARLPPVGRLGRPIQPVPEARFIHPELAGHLAHRDLPLDHLLRDHKLVLPQPCHPVLRAGGLGLHSPGREGGPPRAVPSMAGAGLCLFTGAGIWPQGKK
jgi:hypothetical protein